MLIDERIGSWAALIAGLLMSMLITLLIDADETIILMTSSPAPAVAHDDKNFCSCLLLIDFAIYLIAVEESARSRFDDYRYAHIFTHYTCWCSWRHYLGGRRLIWYYSLITLLMIIICASLTPDMLIPALHFIPDWLMARMFLSILLILAYRYAHWRSLCSFFTHSYIDNIALFTVCLLIKEGVEYSHDIAHDFSWIEDIDKENAFAKKAFPLLMPSSFFDNIR